MSIILLFAFKSNAQITLDTTLLCPPLWSIIGYAFYPVQISENETKYVVTDTVSNTFNIYNMDFTPFMLNIAVPGPFLNSDGSYYYVMYVTRTVFDNNPDDIEYIFSSPTGHANRKFYIMRTNGDVLFERDSSFCPYDYGILGASQEIRPIFNTSAGLKLYLDKTGNSPFKMSIYSLPGTLPSNMYRFEKFNRSFVKVFPNPASNTLTFEISPPDNINDYELIITNTNAEEITRTKIAGNNYRYTINVSDLSSGIYFYTLSTKNKPYQSGKFIITK